MSTLSATANNSYLRDTDGANNAFTGNIPRLEGDSTYAGVTLSIQKQADASEVTVSDEVLRLIAMNRGWARNYSIIHNLARNPKTPIPTAMNILLRIRTKDLQNLSQNRNVSETVRRQAHRLFRGSQ